MEVLDQAEVFVEKDDDYEFGYTSIVAKQGSKIFYGKSPHRLKVPSEINVDEVSLLEIPMDQIWPRWSPKLTRAPQQLPPGTYVKKPNLLDFNPATSSELGNLLLVEAEVCQALMEYPHPNIAKYLGCVVEDGVVKGLCFVEYSTTLVHRVKMGELVNVDRCLEGIESGTRHMHSLGFVHNDLSPYNIMMEGDDPIIVDFDSSTREGQETGWKRGTPGWSMEGLQYGHPDNDFYSISKIREFIVKEARQA